MEITWCQASRVSHVMLLINLQHVFYTYTYQQIFKRPSGIPKADSRVQYLERVFPEAHSRDVLAWLNAGL